MSMASVIITFLSPFLLLLVIILIPLILSSIRIIREWERGIVFTLGKLSGVWEPGLHIMIPILQQVRVVDLRITTVDIPNQEVMTEDNVSVTVNGVVYYRVEDPVKAVLKIKDYHYAVGMYAQTALRDVIGNVSLDDLLAKREEIANKIEEIVDQEVSDWGLDITAIKIQDVILPETMKRAMARQAEAEREKRGVIIKSQGEIEAAKNLIKAADMIASNPSAMTLRVLNTISDISSDPSAKMYFFIPTDFFEYIRKRKSSKP